MVVKRSSNADRVQQFTFTMNCNFGLRSNVVFRFTPIAWQYHGYHVCYFYTLCIQSMHIYLAFPSRSVLLYPLPFPHPFPSPLHAFSERRCVINPRVSHRLIIPPLLLSLSQSIISMQATSPSKPLCS